MKGKGPTCCGFCHAGSRMARSGLIPRSANCLSTSGTNVSLSPSSLSSSFVDDGYLTLVFVN